MQLFYRLVPPPLPPALAAHPKNCHFPLSPKTPWMTSKYLGYERMWPPLGKILATPWMTFIPKMLLILSATAKYQQQPESLVRYLTKISSCNAWWWTIWGKAILHTLRMQNIVKKRKWCILFQDTWYWQLLQLSICFALPLREKHGRSKLLRILTNSLLVKKCKMELALPSFKLARNCFTFSGVFAFFQSSVTIPRITFRAFEALALPSKLSHLERKIALVESCLRNQITASFLVCIKILSCFKRNSVSLWRIKRKQRLQTFAWTA